MSDTTNNPTILVTGAGDGLGRAAAVALGSAGYTVILLGRTVHKLESAYDAITLAGGPDPAIYPMNMEGATGEDFYQLADTLKENFGHIDGVLHNVAKVGRNSPIAQYSPREWVKTMHLNLNAPFLLTQALLPIMRPAANSKIIFTLDAMALSGPAYWGPYAASKAGLESLMSTLANEYENSPLTVCGITPPPCATNLRSIIYSGEDASLLPKPNAMAKYYVNLFATSKPALHGKVIPLLDLA